MPPVPSTHPGLPHLLSHPKEGGRERERERAEGGEVETRVQSGCSGEWGDEWSGESGLEGGVERIGVYSHSIMTYREVEKTNGNRYVLGFIKAFKKSGRGSTNGGPFSYPQCSIALLIRSRKIGTPSSYGKPRIA